MTASPSESAGLPTLADLNAHAGTLNEHMGVEIREATPERVVATMPVAPNLQPFGLLHGGASAALAETCGSILSWLVAGPGRIAVGMSLNATHHRPATSGHVTATTTVIASGRTTATTLTEIVDDEGNRVCTCTLLCALRDAPPQKR